MNGEILSDNDCSSEYYHVQRRVLRLNPQNMNINGLPERESDAFRLSPLSPPVIIIIDSRPLTRLSISQMLERHLGEVRVIAFATADQLLDRESTDGGDVRLIILNIGAVDVREQEFLHEVKILRARLPDIPVIVFADRGLIEDVKEALRQGVRGYVPTSLDPSVAISAVRLVEAGGTYIPESVLLHMLQPEAAAQDAAPPAAPSPGDFTPRQCEVLRLLREGKSNKVIARELDMQESTVKVHLRQIMRKLNAHNRTQAVIIASALDRLDTGA